MGGISEIWTDCPVLRHPWAFPSLPVLPALRQRATAVAASRNDPDTLGCTPCMGLMVSNSFAPVNYAMLNKPHFKKEFVED